MIHSFKPYFVSLRVVFALLMLIFCTASLQAKDVSVTSLLNPTTASINEIATYSIIIQGSSKTSPLSLPKIPGLRSSFVGKSQSFQIVNGFSQTKLVFNYALVASQEGEYDIPTFTIFVDQTPYSVPGQKLIVQASSQTNIMQKLGIALETSFSKEELYIGELLPITITLKVPPGIQGKILSAGPIKVGEGFIDTGFDKAPKQHTNATEGTQEITWETCIKATKASPSSLYYKLPMSLIIHTQKSHTLDNTIDDLFGNAFLDPLRLFGRQEEEIIVSSPLQNITILPLPEEGRPSGYSGAIGTFSIQPIQSSLMDPQVGDPVTLTLVISGQGNIQTLPAPCLPKDSRIKIYPPKEKYIADENSISSGSKVFEYILIPQETGTIELPPIEFSYFDPQTKTYPTLACSIPKLFVNPPTCAPMPVIAPTPVLPTCVPLEPSVTTPPIMVDLGALKPSLRPPLCYSSLYKKTQIGIGISLLIWLSCLFYQRKKSKIDNTKLLQSQVPIFLNEALLAAKSSNAKEFLNKAFSLLHIKFKLLHPTLKSDLQSIESYCLENSIPLDVIENIRTLYHLRDNVFFAGLVLDEKDLEQEYKRLVSIIEKLSSFE